MATIKESSYFVGLSVNQIIDEISKSYVINKSPRGYYELIKKEDKPIIIIEYKTAMSAKRYNIVMDTLAEFELIRIPTELIYRWIVEENSTDIKGIIRDVLKTHAVSEY